MVIGNIESEKDILKQFEKFDFTIDTLGKATIKSHLSSATFISDDTKTLYTTDSRIVDIFYKNGKTPPSFEVAGPREKLYFDPSKVRTAIATCGGLCPGLNDVIRALVMELYWIYGAKKDIYGIRYGLQGFIHKYDHDFMMLNPTNVKEIHTKGGTILGSSRGNQSSAEIVDTLERNNINILFMIGGDGTLRATKSIYEEIKKRELKISVIGIPKTIDNDIPFIQRSFGFETAFSIAVQSIQAAHNEAEGAPNGVGIVKLMGRHSGYIVANAALGLRDVNYVLVPEIDFDLEGENGLLKELEERLKRRSHAVIVAAEGAGQKFFKSEKVEKDASGNIKLHDIGLFLKDKIKKYFKEKNMSINIKYIDPSYIIRGLPANANDSAFAGVLAQSAVHSAMSGRTGLVVGRWNNEFTHVPLKMVCAFKKNITDVNVNFWYSVIEATGHPQNMTNKDQV